MDPAKMSNLPATLREKLATGINWHLPEVHSSLNSTDGSTKLLLKTATGQFMEAVILRYENRTSLCVSSQVGCKLACTFSAEDPVFLRQWLRVLVQRFVDIC